MPQPQLSVRSARAKDLAHDLARREGRTVAEIVEAALECYEERARSAMNAQKSERLDALDRVIATIKARAVTEPDGGSDLRDLYDDTGMPR